MDNNVGKIKIAVEKPVLHRMRDIMAFADCGFASYAHMNIREPHEAALAHPAFFHTIGDQRM
jgi:hypothetical protein